MERREDREEKVQGRPAGSSGLLSKDEWGKARLEEASAGEELGPLAGSGRQALAWVGQSTGREQWMLIHRGRAGDLP